MYTTINKQHKDYFNLIKFENSKDFIKTFKNHKDIILVIGIYECKYKKFKDYYIKYSYCNNYLKSITYYNYSGNMHRENGPAYIYYYDNGKISYKDYYLNGERHREDGHAYISYWEDGTISNKGYYINGKKHREDGPAFITYYNDKIYYKKYYLNNEEYSYEDYLAELKCIQQ